MKSWLIPPAAAAVLHLAFAPGAPAQMPDGWLAVADAGPGVEVSFQPMSPGWHLFPGPAALVYQPEETVDATFRVEYDAHGFSDATGGYGVFFGAQNVVPATYDFFEILLDGQGRFRLGHNAGSAYHEVVPWTFHEAIAIPEGDEPAFNELVVEVSPELLTVRINDGEVASFQPPSYARFDGLVGLRVLDDANLHITRFEVTDTTP